MKIDTSADDRLINRVVAAICIAIFMYGFCTALFIFGFLVGGLIA